MSLILLILEIAATYTAKVARVLPRKLMICLLLAQLYPGSPQYHNHTHIQKHNSALLLIQTLLWG